MGRRFDALRFDADWRSGLLGLDEERDSGDCPEKERELERAKHG
jgi:hypothetical protein